MSVRPLLAALVVFLPATLLAQPVVAPDADPRVAQLVSSVSQDRLRTLATTLVSFGTRETMSTTTSPTRGIGAARQWLFD